MKGFIAILLILACIMTCTNKCSIGSATKEFKNGNVDEAYEKFIEADTYDMSASDLYYYYLACVHVGDDNSENIKIKAYNELVNDDKETRKFIEEFGQVEYENLIQFGEEKFLEQSLERNKQKAFEASLLFIKENAKNPSSIKVLSEKIMASKLQGERSYYIVKSRVSGTNGFGATVTSWYVTEVIVDVDGNMYNKGNIQTFDSEPTQSQIDLCKSIFGW